MSLLNNGPSFLPDSDLTSETERAFLRLESNSRYEMRGWWNLTQLKREKKILQWSFDAELCNVSSFIKQNLPSFQKVLDSMHTQENGISVDIFMHYLYMNPAWPQPGVTLSVGKTLKCWKGPGGWCSSRLAQGCKSRFLVSLRVFRTKCRYY